MEDAYVVLVTGGRDYSDRVAVFSALDKVHAKYPNLTILHGACSTGADALADAWATERERPCWRVPAEWAKYGDRAGPLRNERMICYLPNACVAFPGGAGTRNCVDVAERAALKVWFPAGR
jgi:hypothetical protein